MALQRASPASSAMQLIDLPALHGRCTQPLLKSQNIAPATLLLEFCAFFLIGVLCYLNTAFLQRRTQCFLALSHPLHSCPGPSGPEIAPFVSTMQLGTLSHTEVI